MRKSAALVVATVLALTVPFLVADSGPSDRPTTPVERVYLDALEPHRAMGMREGTLSLFVHLTPPEEDAALGVAGRREARSFASRNGGRVHREYTILPNVINLRDVPVEKIAELEKLPGVARVTVDGISHGQLDDSLTLIRASRSPNQLGSLEPLLGAIPSGAGSRICIVDSGIYDDHEMFSAGAIGAGREFVDNGEYPDWFHGTHVAGIAAGRPVSSSAFPDEATCELDLHGIAPGATLIDAKVLGHLGGGMNSDIVAGIEYCANQVSGGKADVINLSLGGPPGADCDTHELTMAAERAVLVHGAVVVAATGNAGLGSPVAAPACGPNVIAVGSVFDSDYPTCAVPCDPALVDQCVQDSYCIEQHEEEGERVCTSTGGPELDVVAPGCKILSAALPLADDCPGGGLCLDGDCSGGDLDEQPCRLPACPGGTCVDNTCVGGDDEGYSCYDLDTFYRGACGTSMATPHVAGLAAMMLEVDPRLTPAEVRSFLIDNSTDQGPEGYDEAYGWGRIDALATLGAVACDDGSFCNGRETFDDVTSTCVDGAPPCSGAAFCDEDLDQCASGCGDGTVDAGEECDDSGESATCDSDCTLASCGDGTVNSTAGEACDDGNSTDFDGCSSACEIEIPGDPIVENGNFSNGKASWTFWTNGTGSFQVVSGEAQVSITTVGNNTQLYQKDISVQGSTQYRLRLRGSSNDSSRVEVYLQKHGSPYSNYGLSATVNLTTTDTEHVVEFTTTAGDKSDARLRFWMDDGVAQDGTVYYFDDVVIEAVDASPECGNGITDSGEECDDGNTVGGDGCEYDCTVTLCPATRSCPGDDCATGGQCEVDPNGSSTPVNYEFSTCRQASGEVLSCSASESVHTITTPCRQCDCCTTVGCICPLNCGDQIELACCVDGDCDPNQGPPILTNGDFSAGKPPWKFYSNGSAQFTVSQAEAVIDVTSGGSNVQLYQFGISIEGSTQYRLRFRGSSSNGANVDVFLHKHTTPHTNYGLSATNVNLTSTKTEHVLEFTSTPGDKDDARLRFWFAPHDNNGPTYHLDDIVIEEIP